MDGNTLTKVGQVSFPSGRVCGHLAGSRPVPFSDPRNVCFVPRNETMLVLACQRFRYCQDILNSHIQDINTGAILGYKERPFQPLNVYIWFAGDTRGGVVAAPTRKRSIIGIIESLKKN
jgi:hypothetical protein